MHEIFNSLRDSGKKDLKEAAAKKDLSPSDWSTVKTILSAMCKMKELEEDSSEDYEMSTRRGRSARTGRYVSMDRWPHNYPRYDGVSGHGVTERMTDLIDRMYDYARTDQERRELDKWMDRIQAGD